MDTVKNRKYNVKVVEASEQSGYISDSDAEMAIRAVEAVSAALSKAEICKKPIAKYDADKKEAYVEYPNGRKVNVR